MACSAGKIEQVGTPLELYNTPENRFVAGFIGAPHMNFLEGTVSSVQSGYFLLVALADGYQLTIPTRDTALEKGANITLGIRPQHVALGSGGKSIRAKIQLVEALGSGKSASHSSRRAKISGRYARTA